MLGKMFQCHLECLKYGTSCSTKQKKNKVHRLNSETERTNIKSYLSESEFLCPSIANRPNVSIEHLKMYSKQAINATSFEMYSHYYP